MNKYDRDPFNAPETAHPRARQLMREEFFWDCVDEEAPFGSDEGWQAYYEFRGWRRTSGKNLVECLSWICMGNLDGYNHGTPSAAPGRWMSLFLNQKSTAPNEILSVLCSSVSLTRRPLIFVPLVDSKSRRTQTPSRKTISA